MPMTMQWGLYDMLKQGDIVVAKRDWYTQDGVFIFKAGESYTIKYSSDVMTMVIYAFVNSSQPTVGFPNDEFDKVFTYSNPTDNYDHAMGIV